MTTSRSQAYNPLDKFNLARSIEVELLARNSIPLGEAQRVRGAGVYALYYHGPFPAYAPVSSSSAPSSDQRPIYVGKAIPKGGRKGGLTEDASATSRAMSDRLRQHAVSIAEVTNLEVSDFSVRYLVVEDIWIPLGENMLIETFKPVWNIALDGFGNKTPGRRRETQYKSPWDVVHPGRAFALRLATPPTTAEFFLSRIADHLAGRPLQRLPRVLAEQEADEQREAEDSADEA